jgi:NitT/TauT family transport system ATP-binding protein
VQLPPQRGSARGFAKGGTIKDDIAIDLPFPREPADENVAIARAKVLKKFEELDLVAT